MKFILASIVLTFGLGCSQQQGGGAPSNPPVEPTKAALLSHEFKSEEGRFSVNLPVEPKHTSDTLGPSVVMHMYAVETPKMGYMINYFDVPPSSKVGRTDDEILSDAVSTASARFESPTKEISAISIDEYPGKRVSVVGVHLGSRIHMEMEVFLVEMRAYQLMLVADEEIPEELQAAFFNSFKVFPVSPALAEEATTP